MRLLFARIGIPYSPGDGPAHREPDRQPDGRPHHGHAGGNAALSAGPHRARAQGRIPQGAGGAAEARLPAGQGRRPALRDRQGAGPQQEAEARYRGRGRPHRRAARAGDAAGGFHRDRPQPRRRAALRREGRDRQDRGRARHLLRPLRLPGLGLHHRRDRAAALLLQQSLRRLPGLRRAGHDAVLRSRAGGARRDARACAKAPSRPGPIRPRNTTTRPWRAWPSTTRSTSTRPAAACRRRCARRSCSAPGDEPVVMQYDDGLRSYTHHQALRGRHPQHGAPLPRDRQQLGARGARRATRTTAPARSARASA